MMELVCPAGTPAALRAAVDAGAHTVYCGFANETNARNFPGLNFSRDELAAGVAYATARDAKVLVAINTFPRAGAEQLWHRAIADAARNPFLIQTLEYLGQFLLGATQVTRANEARRMDFAAEVQTEHQAILHAVQAGDVEAARHAAAAHMGNAIRRIQGAPPDFWQQEGERLAQPFVKGLQH